VRSTAKDSRRPSRRSRHRRPTLADESVDGPAVGPAGAWPVEARRGEPPHASWGEPWQGPGDAVASEPGSAGSPWADAFSALAVLTILAVLATFVGSQVALAVWVGDLDAYLQVHADPVQRVADIERALVLLAGLLLLVGRARAAGAALLAAVVASLAAHTMGAAGVGRFGDVWAHPELVAIVSLSSSIVPIALMLVSGITLVLVPDGRRGVDLWGAGNIVWVGLVWAVATGLQNWLVVERGAWARYWLVDVVLRVLVWFVTVAMLWPRVRVRTDRRRLIRLLLTAWVFVSGLPYLVLETFWDWTRDDAPIVPVHVSATVGALLVADIAILLGAAVVTLVLLRRPADVDDPAADASWPVAPGGPGSGVGGDVHGWGGSS
jgi:hypothetical protein